MPQPKRKDVLIVAHPMDASGAIGQIPKDRYQRTTYDKHPDAQRYLQGMDVPEIVVVVLNGQNLATGLLLLQTAQFRNVPFIGGIVVAQTVSEDVLKMIDHVYPGEMARQIGSSRLLLTANPDNFARFKFNDWDNEVTEEAPGTFLSVRWMHFLNKLLRK